MTFVSWVPTVTGHLSFSTMGLSRTPNKVIQCYRQIDGKRYIIACQYRSTSDAMPIIDWYLDRIGNLYFIFLGISTDEDSFDTVKGPCFVLGHESFHVVRSAIESYATDPKFSSDDLNSLICKIESLCKKPDFIRCGVILWRDGRVKINVPSLNEVYDVSFPDTIGSQIYFFVRDICHKHQHHSDRSDTILDVIQADEFSTKWRREILYSFYRWIIHRKRDKEYSSYISALGVLSYAKAFKRKHVEDSPDYSNGDVPKYIDDALRESLDAGAITSKAADDHRNRMSGLLVSIYLFCFTYLLAIIAYVTLQIRFRSLASYEQSIVFESKQTALFFRVGNFITEYPVFVFFAPIALLLFYFAADYMYLFRRRAGSDLRSLARIYLFVMRVLFSLQQRFAFAIAALICIGCLIVAWALLGRILF